MKSNICLKPSTATKQQDLMESQQGYSKLLSQIINKCQHGFLQGKSCVTNLLEVLDYIGRILDNGGQVDTIYLDMSKAFDRINHRKLINKLRNFGCGGSLLKWFSLYLTGRRQRITVLATWCYIKHTSYIIRCPARLHPWTSSVFVICQRPSRFSDNQQSSNVC